MFIIFIKRELKRVKVLYSLFIIVFIFLGVRLYFLQVYPTEQVVSNYTNKQTENISDYKYTILDTSGNDMSKYNEKYIIVIDKKPFSLNNYENTLEELIAFNFIMKKEIGDFNFTSIMQSSGKSYFDVSRETYEKAEKLTNVKGVYYYIRNELDKKEAWSLPVFLQRTYKEEDLVDDSMQSNIYKYTKDNLLIQRNFHLNNEAMYNESEVYVSEGNINLKLTINSDIEEKVREVLDKEEYKTYDNIGVILLESNTGKIRAMMQKDESYANINLGMEGSGFEPGSIFKLITLSSALETGKTAMGEEHYCSGSICSNGAHGKLTVNEALEKSCNDIFAKLGESVSYEKIMEHSKELGLFKRVLDIQGETLGMQPKAQDGMSNVSIGQCLTVSPLQMLGAVNAIVNNGVYIKPYLIENLLDYNNKNIETFENNKEKVFSKTTSSLVKESMESVVANGTGREAFVEGVEMGGKTGTATGAGGNSSHGWFVGYFKFQEKTYTMIVFVPEISKNDEDNEELAGGNTAAPIFGDIVKNIIESK